MSDTFYRLLEQAGDRVILMDGGMGSSVQDYGIDIGTHLWGSYALVTDEGRAVNDRIHRDFVEVGAEVLITNTHDSPLFICKNFLDNYSLDSIQVPQAIADTAPSKRVAALKAFLMEESAASARRAVPDDRTVAVATCIDSYEGPYVTESSHSATEIRDYMIKEIPFHQDVDTDLMIFETLTTRQEMQGIAQAVKHHDLSNFAVGLTCSPDGRSMAGVTMAEAVDIFSEVRPVVYFIQCTNYDIVAPALTALTEALGSDGITGVYANDARPWESPNWVGPRLSTKKYTDAAREWRDIGARIIGGCCGIQPKHIAALKKTFSA